MLVSAIGYLNNKKVSLKESEYSNSPARIQTKQGFGTFRVESVSNRKSGFLTLLSSLLSSHKSNNVQKFDVKG